MALVQDYGKCSASRGVSYVLGMLPKVFKELEANLSVVNQVTHPLLNQQIDVVLLLKTGHHATQSGLIIHA